MLQYVIAQGDVYQRQSLWSLKERGSPNLFFVGALKIMCRVLQAFGLEPTKKMVLGLLGTAFCAGGMLQTESASCNRHAPVKQTVGFFGLVKRIKVAWDSTSSPQIQMTTT